MTADLRSLLPRELARVLPSLARTQHLKVGPKVARGAAEVVGAILQDNPTRVATELKDPDIGKAQSGDVAFSLATRLANIMINNAFYEGRKTIEMGDVYLALVDIEKAHAWPW